METTPVETRWLSCKILPESCKNCLSCKNCQKNGYLARSARKMVILQDSCKFVPVELSSYWLPFNYHISFWPEIFLRISCVFFKKNNEFKLILNLEIWIIWRKQIKICLWELLTQNKLLLKTVFFNFIKIYETTRLDYFFWWKNYVILVFAS